MIIYQLTNTTKVQMMCYILPMPDGKTVVIDGGNVHQSDEIFRILTENGITAVDTWFLTHIHDDHFDAIIEFCEKHPDFPIGKIVRSSMPGSVPFMKGSEKTAYERWMAFEAQTKIPLVEAQIGDKFTFENASLEVLSVSNPEISVNLFNNQSMVLRFEDPTFSLLFLGDLGVEGGEKLLKNQPLEKLTCTGVQMAHHGQNGVNRAFYEAVQPTFAFWSTPDWLWENRRDCDMNNPFNSGVWATVEVRSWMQALHTVNVTSFYHSVAFNTETGKWTFA